MCWIALLKYAEYPLQAGGYRIHENQESEIELHFSVKFIPASICLVESVSPNLKKKCFDVKWTTSRAILCPSNRRVASMAEKDAKRFLRSFSLIRSADYKSWESWESLEAQIKVEFRNQRSSWTPLRGAHRSLIMKLSRKKASFAWYYWKSSDVWVVSMELDTWLR